MNIIGFYQVDAFSSKPFCGNPAAVCPLNEWLDDEILQAISAENNLSETAFFVPNADGYDLRWFTPSVEVDLCGHATLAASWVLYNKLHYNKKNHIKFYTRSGLLIVSKHGDEYCMDFPAKTYERIDAPTDLLESLGISSGVLGVWKSDDLIVMVKNKNIIDNLSPDFIKLKKINTRGVVVTSSDKNFDFVSRWFGPQVGVNEDPVTGSAHTFLAPLWSEILKKKNLFAQQGGARKGELRCVIRDDSRVELYGEAFMTIEGFLRFDV